MYEESPSSIISPNDITSNSISLNTTSPTIDVGGRGNVDELRNLVRKLEAENLALRRSLPRIHDLDGNDVTDEMVQLTAQLATVESRLEDVDNLCARKHEELERLHSNYVELEAAKDAEIRDAVQRAVYFEQECERLQKELEDDQSRLFHLNEQHQQQKPKSREKDASSLRATQAEISRRNELLGAQLLEGGAASTALRQHLGELNDELASLSLSSASQASVIESGDARRHRHRLTSTSFSELVHMDSAGADAVNRTVLDVTQDMHAVSARMNALQTVCRHLFEKLSDTAVFLEALLTTLNDAESEEARRIVERIRDIKLDLDKSMNEAQQATDMLARSRQSLADLRTFVERTAIDGGDIPPPTNHSISAELSSRSRPPSPAASDTSVRSTSSAPPSIGGPSMRSTELNKAVDHLTKANATLKNTLHRELALKDALNAELTDFKGRVEQLEMQLHDVNEDLGRFRNIINKQRSDLETQAHHLNKYYDERKETIELYKQRDAQLRQLQEGEAAMHAQLQQLDRTCRDLFDEKTEVQRRLEQTRLDLEAESEKVQQLRISNLDYDKLNRDLHKRFGELKSEYDKVVIGYGETNEIINRANLLVYRKVHEGLKELQFAGEDSWKDDVTLMQNVDPHGAYCHEEFTDFLADCQRRSSHIVGLLKKSEEVMNATRIGLELPFMPHLMAEARAVRMMLYKIHKFFHSQRENKNPGKRISCREICAELKRIYATMTAAHSVTHDTHSSALQPPAEAPQRSNRNERPKGDSGSGVNGNGAATAPTTMRGGTASDDASLRHTPQAWPTPAAAADNWHRGQAPSSRKH